MNDRWLKADGTRWAPEEVTRIQRRFRHHVRTKWNPRGRIHRERCVFANDARKHVGKCWSYAVDAEGAPRTEAHHVDHNRPWCVAWLCTTHHRKVERGALHLSTRQLWDYASLIEPIGKPGLRVGDEAAPF